MSDITSISNLDDYRIYEMTLKYRGLTFCKTIVAKPSEIEYEPEDVALEVEFEKLGHLEIMAESATPPYLESSC